MIYYSISQLLEQLNGLFDPAKAKDKCRTVFILLPDSDAWYDVITFLHKRCSHDIRLSDLCKNDMLPAAPYIHAQLKKLKGTAVISPLGEIIRRHIYPELITQLCRRSSSAGMLFVPLMACSHEFHLQLNGDEQKCKILELNGDDRPCTLECYAPRLAPKGCLSLSEYMRAMESENPLEHARIYMRSPALFAGRDSRVISSGYIAMSTWLHDLEFVVSENALTDEQWCRLMSALKSIFEYEDISTREAFDRCIQMDADNALLPGDSWRLAAWLGRLSGLYAGDYMRHVLCSEAYYKSLEEAVALEILAEFKPERTCDDTLSPELMSADAWMSIRRERAEMLQHLGIHKLPDEYWQTLKYVPMRRKLLYSSLYTEDERAFCREYLQGAYNMPPQQIILREDIRKLYPELIKEIQMA